MIHWLIREDFGGEIGGVRGILRLKLTASLPLRYFSKLSLKYK